MKGGAIALESAEHHLVRAENSVGQSAAIHSLRDCELSEAESGAEVLAHFLRAAAGRVLVFHNAALDMAFLDRVSRREFNAPVLLPAVDTLLQEERLLRRREQAIKPGDHASNPAMSNVPVRRVERSFGYRLRRASSPSPARTAVASATRTANRPGVRMLEKPGMRW